MLAYFVAAEASGDLLAREVAEKIKAARPDVGIAGIGGAELAALGVRSPIDIAPLSVLGFVEGLKAYPEVVRLAKAAADDICRVKPDVVVLVDSWGFTLRVAQRVREADPTIRLIKLIGPQVWATRPGRARTLAKVIDHLLCMHEIEVPFYRELGLKVTVIGNPALSRGKTGDSAAFRNSLGLSTDARILLVLPGSRKSELKRVAPALLQAARLVKAAHADVHVLVQPAQNVLQDLVRDFPDLNDWAQILTDVDARFDAMAAATVVLACSGTVTSEVAMQGAPVIVAYKTGWITWAIARGLLFRKVHISLINILNNDTEIAPEFVQTRMNPSWIASKASVWLSDPQALQAQRERQKAALQALGFNGGPAAENAASAILADLDARQRPIIGT